MKRICGECALYRHGDIENPCEKGDRYCGYLLENKPCWKAREDDEVDEATKVCAKCGRELPISEFYKTKRTKDNLSNVCKICMPHPWLRRKRKKHE